MPRTPREQLWGGGRAQSSSSDDSEDQYPFDESSDLSEMDDDSDFTPDTEDDAMEEELNDSFEDYDFKLKEKVWVKPRGCFDWFPGTVVKIREPVKDAKKRGKLYRVVFRRHFTNMRDVFSAAERHIKPDTPRVRALIGKPRHETLNENERSSSSVTRSQRRRRHPRHREGTGTDTTILGEPARR